MFICDLHLDYTWAQGAPFLSNCDNTEYEAIMAL